MIRPLLAMLVLAALCVAIVALPASLVRRFLPAGVTAEDFSGTLWHGSAGSITLGGRNVGAVEWRLHPWSLLDLGVTADLHWVKTGFVADGVLELTSRDVTLRNLSGGGPIEDLHDLGIGDGWRGTASLKFSRLALSFANGAAGGRPGLTAAVGDLVVSELASPQVAGGADLGGYELRAADATITPGSDATADINDTGAGPLEVKATLHVSADGHIGMFSGTIKAGADAPPALRAEIDNLAQMHARDSSGRIPVDLEFTL